MSAGGVGIPAAGGTTGGRRLLRALPHAGSLALFGVLPVVLMAGLLSERGLGWDFRAFYLGAHAYLSGTSPYPPHSLAAIANKQQFVYPAPMAALFAPFALLPYHAALVLWLVGSVVAIAAALWTVGVRDWRCLGALFLTHPVQESVRLGTLMPLLMLLLALLWRQRERTAAAAALAAVLALSKIFLFPVLLWLAVTRRARAAMLGAVLAAGLTVVSWLPIHLATMAAYPGLLHTLASFEETFSYSMTSFAIGLGLASSTATAVAWSAGVALLALAALAGRSADFLSFRLALAASFVLSPIVWGHYYVLLIVPLALRRPRLSPVWLAAIWLKPDTLALRYAPAWIGAALVVLIVQLDLARPLLGRRFARGVSPRTRLALAVAITLGLLLATGAAGEDGYSSNATLRAATGSRSTSGAASLRVDPPERRLCWRIWTQALPAHRALLAIAPSSESAGLAQPAKIGRDGQSRGCVRLTRAEAALARGLVARPNRYRLFLWAPPTALITGVFHRS